MRTDQFMYSTIGHKPGQYSEGIPFDADRNLLVIYDRSLDEGAEIVVVGLYKKGTFNKGQEEGQPPCTLIGGILDRDLELTVTNLIRKERTLEWPIRFM